MPKINTLYYLTKEQRDLIVEELYEHMRNETYSRDKLCLFEEQVICKLLQNNIFDKTKSAKQYFKFLYRNRRILIHHMRDENNFGLPITIDYTSNDSRMDTTILQQLADKFTNSFIQHVRNNRHEIQDILHIILPIDF